MKSSLVVDLVRAHFAGSDDRFNEILDSIVEDESEKGNASVSVALQNARVTKAPAVVSGQMVIDDVSSYPIMHPMFTRSDVVLSEAVGQEVDRFIEELNHRSELGCHGLSPRTRILLYGPPGCGKTMIAHMIASDLGLDIMQVNFDTLISSYMGCTGQNIRELFRSVRREGCVLFIDEIDAIAKHRGDGNDNGESKRIVISLLQNLDAVGDSAVVVAATNMPDLLDDALFRRFDLTMRVDYPTESQRRAMVSRHFGRHIPMVHYSESLIARMTAGMSGSEIRKLLDSVARRVILTDWKGPVDTEFILDTMDLKNRDGCDVESIYRRMSVLNRNGVSYAHLSKVSGMPASTIRRHVEEYRGSV